MGHLSKRELESVLIRKVIEEWNPFSLEDSIYGAESYEIYKCVVGDNYQNNPQKIAIVIQRQLSRYEKYLNKKIDLEYEKCLEIAIKITNLLDVNKNGDV